MRRASILAIVAMFAGMIAVVVPTSPAAAANVAIHFDDQPENANTVITDQYPSATFSSTEGNVNYVTTQPAYNATQPNFLCSGPAEGSFNCSEETIVSFTTPVSGLTFNAMGVNGTGTVAEVDLFDQEGFVATVPIIGNASGFNPELQDLSSYVGLTSIRIHNITDGAGIGWDDFNFVQDEPVALSTSITGSPDPVTAGNNVLYTVTVTNDSATPVSGVELTNTLPASTTYVSASAPSGCTGTGPVTCSLGTIGPNSSASATIVVKTASGSGGTTATFAATTSPGGDNTTFDTQIVAASPGSASGFVPPGGSIGTGGTNPATLSLPNGPGATVVLTQAAGNFCAGPCVGPATEVNSFPGYNDPHLPISLTLAYAEPNLARSLVTFATATLYKQTGDLIPGVKIRDCVDNPTWTTAQKRAAALRRALRIGTRSGIANPSPCIDERKIVSLPQKKWQVTFKILYLSGDPRFAKR